MFLVVQQGLFGVYMGSSFAPNHKGMPVVGQDEKVDFLRGQVLTSRNIRGSLLTDLALGGLTKECVSRPTDSGLCSDVAQVRVGEERPDQPGAFLEPSQGADGLGFEVLLAGDAGLADPVVLHVLPDPFIGVELG